MKKTKPIPGPRDLPESPLERAKRRSRGLVSVDELVGITERVPVESQCRICGLPARARCSHRDHYL